MVDKELSKNKNIQNPEYMNELFVSKNYEKLNQVALSNLEKS